jgi:hypothetical protein
MRLFTYNKEAPGKKAEFCNNMLIGANVGLQITGWDELTLKNNTVWAVSTLVEVPKEGTDKWQVEGNTYYDNGNATALGSGDFAAWQKRGFDKAGKLLPGKDNCPTGLQTFVFKNEFEKNRANIGVFNFEEAGSAKVDLGMVVDKGTKIAIWNCWDIKGPLSAAKPIVTTVYQGGEITLPLLNTPDCPWFEAFLVREVK